MIFPIADGPKSNIRYIDSWGAPRSGGRTHEGTDILAAMGTPVLAVENGRVEFGVDPLGGNVARLHATSGTRYYYAHLDSFAGESRTVQEGEVIGAVGMTGNAKGTVPHLHFEVHPNEGGPVNPFPLLQAARRVTLGELSPLPSSFTLKVPLPASFYAIAGGVTIAAVAAGAAYWWSKSKSRAPMRRAHARENGAMLEDLFDEVPLYDASRWGTISGIGYADGDGFVTYHVTDDPGRVRRILSRPGVHLMAAYGQAGRRSELGSGLYVSGNPNYWVGRARNKWSFLGRLSKTDLDRLSAALLEEVERQKQHLAISEYEHAVRDIRHVQAGHFEPTILIFLANHPYGIPFWKQEFLRPLRIAAGERPHVLEIRIRGKIADVSRIGHDPRTFRALRRAGAVAAFTRASMSQNPELVIWDSRAIASVREVDL